MAQEIQRHPRGAADAQEQSALTEALAAALAQNSQTNAAEEENNDEVTVDMVELFFHVLSKIHYVILAAVLGTLLAFLYVHFCYTPTYQATAKLYIQDTSSVSVSVANLQVASNLTQDYREVFNTWEVVEGVRDEMPALTADWEVPCTIEEAEEHDLNVSVPSNTRVLYITVQHPRGEVAITMANAYADHALEFIMSRMGNAYEPTEFSAAKDAKIVGMTKMHFLLMGFLLGACLVLVVVVLMFLLDDRPHTPDDITKTAGVPTLAVVPREQNMARSRRRVQPQRKEVRK